MLTLQEIEKYCEQKGLKKYRAKQIYQNTVRNLVNSWDEAIDLPKDLQQVLTNDMPISTLKVREILEAGNGDSIKIAFNTHDGLVIETVLMKHRDERNTVCVSTQAGCPMNCAFCATGKLGLKRSLMAEEIVDQVIEFARLLKKQGESVNSVVFMGMGEPFANYENTISAIEILNDGQGFNIGSRHITVSTSGLAPEILKFAKEKSQVNLAISLHAPNDEIRDSLMPVNKKYPLSKLLPAVSEYMDLTGRKVFFEYILLKGVNDSDENIQELIDLMREYFPNQFNLVHINLIEYNPVGAGLAPAQKRQPQGLPLQFESPSPDRVKKIFDILQKNKILTTIRHKFGQDIKAACGQLAGQG
ncbi:MAG TPA: 23S rRNA (adenine(2503)-C(2))-methyltransferase RlmN [Patescibacteria group bacterium]|nr:23S rRNA (adenine(2503)-C(2))-methyltransferase RlmN [Patescibacteria group bacterium]